MSDQNNPATSGQGFPGQLGLNAATGDFNVHRSIFFQLMARVRTAGIVQVQSCTVTDAVGGIGFVDVVPVIGTVDGLFNVSPHGTIHQLCYTRVQAGNNAVIMDPKKGDLGVAVFCDRDISVLKRLTQAALAALAPLTSPVSPGSRRRWSMVDGIYLFSCLSPSGAPTQYLRFSSTGIDWKDLNGNTMVGDSTGIKVNGVLFDRSQNVTNANEVTSQSGVKLTQHIHGGVTTGSGNTGLPSG